MIFTPEESREIALMLGADIYEGWGQSEATHYLQAFHVRAVLKGVVIFESWREEGSGEILIKPDWPDFSLPEWTGSMLEKVLACGNEYNTLAFSPSGAAWWTCRGYNAAVFNCGNKNINLYRAWLHLTSKHLYETQEASNVRPE